MRQASSGIASDDYQIAPKTQQEYRKDLKDRIMVDNFKAKDSRDEAEGGVKNPDYGDNMVEAKLTNDKLASTIEKETEFL